MLCGAWDVLCPLSSPPLFLLWDRLVETSPQQKTLRLPGWGCATSREVPVQVQPHERGQGSLGSPGLDRLQEQLYKVTSSVR